MLVLVTIRYPPELVEITRKTEDRVELPLGSTLSDLFKALSNRHGEAFRSLVLDSEGNIKQGLLILLNGRSLEKHGELFGTTLGQEDLLTILTPLSGG
jgi:molybdopterin synthase sulfur carrier subunit